VVEGFERSCSIGCRSCTAFTRLSALRSSVDVLIILTVFTLSSKAKDFLRCSHTGQPPLILFLSVMYDNNNNNNNNNMKAKIFRKIGMPEWVNMLCLKQWSSNVNKDRHYILSTTLMVVLLLTMPEV